MNATASTQKLSGLPGGSLAWWLWRNRQALPRVLVAASTDEAAQEITENIAALARWQEPAAPPLAAHFEEDEKAEQVTALSRWAAHRTPWPSSIHFHDTANAPVPFLVASWTAAQALVPAPREFKESQRVLRVGDRLDRSLFLAHLAQAGYARVDAVEQVGEMAVRGEVVDLWSPGWEEPIRLLWPYDRVESLRKINMATQRSTDAVDAVLVRPAQLEGASTLWEHLGEDGLLFETHLPPEARLDWPGRRLTHVELETTGQQENFQPVPPLGNPTDAGPHNIFIKEIKNWLAQGWRVAVFCHNAGEQERLEEILLEQDRTLSAAIDDRRIEFPLGDLATGFLSPDEKLAVLSNGQIFGRTRRRLRLPKFEGGKTLSEIAELSKGDFAVHERFGVGRYKGLVRREAAGAEHEYLYLEYKGGDRVLVPLFEFRQVQKFIGTEGKKPKLSSLDTATWERTKQEVQASVAELAKELLARAAKRAALRGIAFPPDSHLEKEFGDSFLYELTPDQSRAIEEVKRDMVSPRPMDRLICGDVGYGKTEVAMRAAFKAAAAGKQVAVLVPTTILAEQHGRNFRERFADYPVSVAVLSRFAKPADEANVIRDLQRGVIDIVVGTHRLLSSDVVFKNLGLIIIDEEHRFGVKQKERMMAFREVVDVLALSATPIPRTLGAALGGVKNLSVIETPPEGRLPIATHVGPFDEKLVATAIEHELQRGGQVFYVHNRVGTIQARRDWLTHLLHGRGLKTAIGLAHGQMTGTQLEKIMWDFLHKKHDILLSTSIIESGLDIPSVNTLVVEEAEDFGLAQLYQLRGRVGRQRQKAYCYLFFSPGAGLTEEAQKRLGALKEFASLGAGFKLALRDLEIRGAGNLLGPQQHGFVNAVGINLYGQLLTEEMKRQQGEGGEAAAPEEVFSLELPVSAYLPEEYLPSEAERVVFYKRLVDAPLDQLDVLKEELADRCGALPGPALKLFDVAELRGLARRAKVSRVALARDGLEIWFHAEATLPPETVERLMAAHGRDLSFLPGPPFGMRFDPPPAEDLLAWVRAFLSSLGELDKMKR